MAYASGPPNIGGVETLIDEVSTRLGAGGVEVTALTTDRSGELPRDDAPIEQWTDQQKQRPEDSGANRHTLWTGDLSSRRCTTHDAPPIPSKPLGARKFRAR